MTHRIVAAVFASQGAAEQARACLMDAGVAADHIALSANFTADGIAAEAPGQSFSNQPGQGGEVEPTEAYADAARAGTCVVRVDAESDADERSIEGIMRRCGAHHTSRPH